MTGSKILVPTYPLHQLTNRQGVVSKKRKDRVDLIVVYAENSPLKPRGWRFHFVIRASTTDTPPIIIGQRYRLLVE
jgi:hypothetical protein